MAKDIAVGKRAKISQAQQYMLLAVLGTSVLLGAAISLVLHFVNQISFNASVIAAEDQSIVAYSDAIKNIGVCKKPSGNTYTSDELKKCDPNNIEVEDVPNTLRSNILVNMAANEALNSVPKEDSSTCINPSTGKNYTYVELNELYDDAENATELSAVSALIRNCSALRIIPDALPSFKNEEALLSSLNKIFIESNWEPESLSPTGEALASSLGTNLNTFSVRLSVEASTATTMTILNNIERSIREFNVERATIEWGGADSLELQAQATAYFMDPSSLKNAEANKTIRPGGN